MKAIRKNKATLIAKIKEIVSNYGGFTTSEVEANSSPCIKTLGEHTCQLAERFYNHKIEAITYIHENETESEFIPYEDLTTSVLKEILALANKYNTMMKTEA